MKPNKPAENTESRKAREQEDTYFRIMRLVDEQPDICQRELAEKVGISLGALNYCLKALMDKGFVKLENFQNSKHKFKFAYILTPAGMAQKMAMTGRFLRRKMQEYEALKSEIEVLKAQLEDEIKEFKNLTQERRAIRKFLESQR
jgi:EPS-associated MarR family transcriptional regulator